MMINSIFGSDILAMGIVLFFLLVVIALSRNAIVKGSIGEHKVNKILKKHLNPKEYYIIPNVTIVAADKTTTQIDHIVVSRYGIFIIETKNYTGWIFGDKYSKKWTVSRFDKKYSFQNPLHQNYKHVKAIEHIAGIPEKSIFSLVVFLKDAVFKTAMPKEVSHLYGLIDNIKSKQYKLFSQKEVFNIVKTIEENRFSRDFVTNKMHLDGLNSRKM